MEMKTEKKITANVDLSDIQCDLTDRIGKARALCDEVISQYCQYDKADPDSPKESERLHAYELCARYPTWSLLLYCAFDMLREAEDLAWKATDAIDSMKRKDGAAT